MPDEQREELCEAKSQEAVSRRTQSVRAHEPQRGEVDARRRAGAPSHDDMLDCLANIENADLLKKVVWPIALRREPEGGGDVSREEGCAEGGWIIWEVKFGIIKDSQFV